MKKFLQTGILALSLGFIAACSSDDPEPAHEVGIWTLHSINALNLPDAYSFWEGIPFSSAGYTLELNGDGSFIERIVQIDAPNVVLTGTYTLATEKLTLKYKDSEDEAVFDVVKNELDQLWYTFGISYALVSNTNLQKLETDYGTIQKGFDYLDTMDINIPEEKLILEEYYQTVNFDLLYALDRSK